MICARNWGAVLGRHFVRLVVAGNGSNAVIRVFKLINLILEVV